MVIIWKIEEVIWIFVCSITDEPETFFTKKDVLEERIKNFKTKTFEKEDLLHLANDFILEKIPSKILEKSLEKQLKKSNSQDEDIQKRILQVKCLYRACQFFYCLHLCNTWWGLNLHCPAKTWIYLTPY